MKNGWLEEEKERRQKRKISIDTYTSIYRERETNMQRFQTEYSPEVERVVGVGGWGTAPRVVFLSPAAFHPLSTQFSLLDVSLPLRRHDAKVGGERLHLPGEE